MKNGVRQWLFRRLLRVADRRPPDYVIGTPSSPYLRRWWLIPRNRFCNAYLHQILRSDDDRALHDHPWWNCSVLLSGRYLEVLPGGVSRLRREGEVVFRRASALHRLVLTGTGPAWTLFLTGPRLRDWGFACPQGWRPWQEFCAPGDKARVGRGCD